MAERRSRVLPPNRLVTRGSNGQRQPPAPEVSMEPRPVAAPRRWSRASWTPPSTGTAAGSTARPTLAETYRRLREQPGRDGLDRAVPAGRPQLLAVADEFGLHELAVEDAIVGPPAAQAGALRRHAVRGAARRPATSTRPRRSTSASCTCSSGPDFVITVRHGEAPDLAAVRAPDGGRPRPARASGPEAVLYADPGRGGRRVRAGRRGPAERHRRDRDRGLPRRPERLPPHLRAVPRGDRVPAGHPAAARHARRR